MNTNDLPTVQFLTGVLPPRREGVHFAAPGWQVSGQPTDAKRCHRIVHFPHMTVY